MNKRNFYMETVIRIVFVALYTYTAMMKWLDFPVYRIKMRRQHLPDQLKDLFVWGIPITEILVVFALILPFFISTPRLARIGLVANLVLMSSFTIYAGVAASGLMGYVPCSCGGVLEGMSWNFHFMFNLILTGLAALGVWLHRKNGDADFFTPVRG